MRLKLELRTFKKECSCDAEIFVAKRFLTNQPTLSWNRVYDLQDNISYVVEIDGKEFECESGDDERKILWKVPIELEKGKLYYWRVKSYDGYEYSEWSKTQCLQYSDYDEKFISSYIYVNSVEIKELNAEVSVIPKKDELSLGAEISIIYAKRFQPCEINVEIPDFMFLQSSVEVKNRDCRELSAEIFIRTKTLSPPKGPLMVDMQSSFDYVTGNMSPIFSWWKSLDELFSDEVVYDIEVSKDILFKENVVFRKENIKNPISQQMVYPLPICLEIGKYYWRVRANDGLNYSDWVYGNDFTVDYISDDLFAQIYVFDKFTREELLAEIVVNEKNILESEIYVKAQNDFFRPCIVTVCHKTSQYLESEIFVSEGGLSDLPCELNVMGVSELSSEINVALTSELECSIYFKDDDRIYREELLLAQYFTPVNVNFPCKMNVLKRKNENLSCLLVITDKKSDVELPAELNILSLTADDFISAYVDVKKTIYYEYESSLAAKLMIPLHVKIEDSLCGEIEVMKRGVDDIKCEIEILSIKSNAIQIFCEQEEDKWYNNNEINFTWTFDGGELEGYVMQFNDNPDYIPELGKDYFEYEHDNKKFTANVYDNSGEYYFHIVGFDKYYNKTPVSHYRILYNNAPEAPEYLKINEIEYADTGIVVSKNEENIFTWGKSFDKDQNDCDNLKYELIICNKNNFEYLDYESGLLDENQLKISFKYLRMTGKYYWKVRAFDGKEYSVWSKISTFIVNQPPSVPTDIEFFSK